MIEIVALKRNGMSICEISSLTGCDRKTVRKYLANPEIPVYGPRAKRDSKLAPFKSCVDEKLEGGVWNAVAILRELRSQGYEGSYTILKDYISPKRKAAAELCVRRFETPPGVQAQVDWGHLGVIEEDGERHRIQCFTLTLGFSRGMAPDVAKDQKLETFLRMHEEAFQELGGVPREILYDWMKTVASGVDERGEVKWNPLFLDFARHHGFTPKICRPYRPQTKGKVESGVKYVKGSFIPFCRATSFGELRSELQLWNRCVANKRVHGTTHRVVEEALEEERGEKPSSAASAALPIHAR